MHIAVRLVERAAELLSVVTAAVIVFPSQQPPGVSAITSASDDAATWLFRGVLATSLALNAYFLKRLADSVNNCTKTGNEHETRIAILERSYEMFLEAEREALGEKFDRRERKPGRRADDMIQSVRKGSRGD